MPQRERMCTLSGFTKTSDIAKRLHAITQFHLRIFINQKALCRRRHTHTYQQAINLRKRITRNQQTFSLFCVSFTLAHTPWSSSASIFMRPTPSAYLKPGILRVSTQISNIVSGYGFITRPFISFKPSIFASFNPTYRFFCYATCYLLWYRAWKKEGKKKKYSHTSNYMHTHTVGVLPLCHGSLMNK